MISFRTLINTTIFWALALVVFRGYTRWIDNTPAKELLYAIGWSDLGNLTISSNESFGITNEAQLLQKLDTMEKMIQATNMSCALIQLNTSGSQNNTTSLFNSNIWWDSSTQQTINIPTFNAVLNAQLPESEQATIQALSMIQRPIGNNPNINDIFQLIKQPQLSSSEQAQWNINIFDNTNLTLGQYNLNNGTLTLPILWSESLSSAQFWLISSIIEKVYTQFPEITNVIVQQV